MLLHAAKYPHCAVNGLLVAEKQKEKKKDSHSTPILCVDCIPLFHGTLALAPMLEVALTLVSELIVFIFYSHVMFQKCSCYSTACSPLQVTGPVEVEVHYQLAVLLTRQAKLNIMVKEVSDVSTCFNVSIGGVYKKRPSQWC